MEKQLSRQEVRIASTSNFETILTIRELKIPRNTIELKFDTVFIDAKDPQARQSKAQFFIDRKELLKIHSALSNLVDFSRKDKNENKNSLHRYG